jgi:hypothetical protein
VASGRVVIAYKKSFKAAQCIPNTTAAEFNILRALWPESTPSFSNSNTPMLIPGMLGFGNPSPYFDDLAAIGVSDIGTVAVLGAKQSAGFDTTPSLFVWESGLSPGANIQPTPTANDTCPSDINKLEAGTCGCGFAEIDSNGDKVIDCGAPGGINVKGGILSNAPYVEAAGEDLTVLMQQFPSFFNTKAKSTKAKAPKIIGTYEVTATLQGSKLKCGKVKLQSKSNKVKLKKLLSGTYDVSYKMIFTSGQKKLGTTSQSPSAQGTVINNRVKCPPRKKK